MRIRRSRSRRQLRFPTAQQLAHRNGTASRAKRHPVRGKRGEYPGDGSAPCSCRSFPCSVNRLRIVKHLPWRFIATLGRRCSCSAPVTSNNSQSPGLAASRRLTGAPAKHLPRRPTWPSSQHCLRSLLSPANISNRQGQLASRRLTEAPAKRPPQEHDEAHDLEHNIAHALAHSQRAIPQKWHDRIGCLVACGEGIERRSLRSGLGACVGEVDGNTAWR